MTNTTTAQFQADVLRDRYFRARDAEAEAATRLAVLRDLRELRQSEYEAALRRIARETPEGSE